MVYWTIYSNIFKQFSILTEFHNQINFALSLNDFLNFNYIFMTKFLTNFHFILNCFVIRFSEIDNFCSKLLISFYMECFMNSSISSTTNLLSNAVVSNNNSFLISSLFNIDKPSLLMISFRYILYLLHIVK